MSIERIHFIRGESAPSLSESEEIRLSPEERRQCIKDAIEEFSTQYVPVRASMKGAKADWYTRIKRNIGRRRLWTESRIREYVEDFFSRMKDKVSKKTKELQREAREARKAARAEREENERLRRAALESGA